MALPIIGGIIGREAARGDRERQRELYEQALRDLEALQAPELSPIQQRTLDRAPYTSLPTNAGGRDLEDEALASLADVSRSGGLGAQGRLSMEQARLQSAAQANRANAAIQANAARRGMGGNAALVAQQVAQQGANQNASLAGMQAAAAAENRRIGATQALGGMASQVEGRRQQQLMERARQLDAINQFEARMGLQTDMANRGFQQQNFQNQLGLADRRYDARQRAGGQAGQRAQDTAGMWAGMGEELQNIGVQAGSMIMGNPAGAMGGGARGAMGGQAPAAQAPQRSASGLPGPYRPAVQPNYFALPDWYNYPGY